MTGAGEDTDSGEPAFTAALQSYLDSRDKDFYQPRIQQKPVSAYQLWKLVAKAGGSEKVRPFPGTSCAGIACKTIFLSATCMTVCALTLTVHGAQSSELQAALKILLCASMSARKGILLCNATSTVRAWKSKNLGLT